MASLRCCSFLLFPSNAAANLALLCRAESSLMIGHYLYCTMSASLRALPLFSPTSHLDTALSNACPLAIGPMYAAVSQ